MSYKTKQEDFWAGKFGSEYVQRNQGDQLLASSINFFSRSLKMTNNIQSCIEFGANIGLNLNALSILYPKKELYGIEINKDAGKELSKVISKSHIFQTSILEFDNNIKCDLVLIKGVLIHINPDELLKVYSKLVDASSRYLLIAEYYNPSPVSIPYRGHNDRLFKRDFAGEILDKYPEFSLIDYGFLYHRDLNFPQDDITWFLLEK
jgi:spore coat polysaccharide biosynthesis protein SpsF